MLQEPLLLPPAAQAVQRTERSDGPKAHRHGRGRPVAVCHHPLLECRQLIVTCDLEKNRLEGLLSIPQAFLTFWMALHVSAMLSWEALVVSALAMTGPSSGAIICSLEEEDSSEENKSNMTTMRLGVALSMSTQVTRRKLLML